MNKAKKDFKAQGIQARKNEKKRKKCLQRFLARGEKLPVGMDIPIFDPEKNPSDADLEVLLPHLFLIEALDAAQFSRSRPRIVLDRERIEEMVETGASSTKKRAGEVGLELRGDDSEDLDDKVAMVTEVVEEEPDQVDLEDSSGSEAELSHTPLADSSDAASHSLDDSITQNAGFVAFSS